MSLPIAASRRRVRLVKPWGFDPESLQRLSGLVANYEWCGRDRNDTTIARSFFRMRDSMYSIRALRKYLELCMRIQDFPRHLETALGWHGDLPKANSTESSLWSERRWHGRTVVQWDKEDCANLGIIKVDLLGLGMMAVLKDCLDSYPSTTANLSIWHNYPKMKRYIERCSVPDTIGMFQVESQAQKSSLPKNRPEKFYDLVVAESPSFDQGPVVGKMMHPACAAARSRKR